MTISVLKKTKENQRKKNKEAFSKKMGKIQVNVDGKKLAVINTGSISTKSKAKSWIGIGTGNHKIEIIPILDPGQSIGIDAYQVARAV